VNTHATLQRSGKRWLPILLGLSVAGMGIRSASAAWVGDVDSDWNNASNWSGDTFPVTPTDAIVDNTAGPGVFPVITGNAAFTPRDIRVGTTGAIGRVDHRAGTMGTGDGNWFFLGYVGSNATYNLADTAGVGGSTTGFAQGSGSLNIGGATQNGNLLIGLDNGTVSTLNVHTTGNLIGGGMFLGAAGGSNGHVNVDSGNVNFSGEIQIGANFFSQGSGTNNTMNVSGGTVTADIVSLARGNNGAAAMTGTLTLTGGTVSTKRYFTLGFAGAVADTAVVNNNGGTININTAGGGVLEMAVFDQTTNTFNQNSGATTLQNNAAIQYGSGGNHSGTSTFNQNGGTVTFYSDAGTTVGGTGSINLGNGASTGTYAYNLNGGTLTVPAITKTSAGASGTFNFNGGTLKPTANNTSFLSGITRANVRNGGAVFDTNGFNVTVGQPLVHSNIGGDSATDGGVTKNGNGLLVYTGINSYNGNTTVNAGTLQAFDDSGLAFVIGANGVNNTITGSGTVQLDGDFNFDLSGAGTTLGDSWSIVNVASLNETFGPTFTVSSFTDAGSNLWTKDINGTKYYEFSEGTGVLRVTQAVPEPAASLMLLSSAGIMAMRRRSSSQRSRSGEPNSHGDSN
jgi:autotransporter-associated beta strand protein